MDDSDELSANANSTPIADFSPKHPAFYVPFRQKGDQVVGRNDALAEVRRQLQEGRRTSIGQAAAFNGLDGLPLAIELAGAYLRYRPAATYTGYLELFEEGVTSALSRGDFDSFTKHDAYVASALVLHDRLIEDAPALPTILKVLTWSASAAMSRGLLQALLPDVSPADLREALDLGESLRLLRRVPDRDRYAIHRLVAEVRREGEAPAAEWVTAMARRVSLWFKERRIEFGELEAYEADLDHLDEWTSRVEPHDQALAAELIWLQAYPPYHRGQHNLILDRLNKARDLFDASGVDDPEFDAHLLHDLSTALAMGGIIVDRSLLPRHR